MAIWRGSPSPGLIHHPDQGIQYTSLSFGKRLEEASIVPSMRRVGSAYDNSMAESFTATLKTELLYRGRWSTRESARTAIFEYLEGRSYSQDLAASVPDEATPMPDSVGGDAATTGTSMR